MAAPTPSIDRRTSADIVKQVQDLSKIGTLEWPKFDPSQGIGAALVGVFARYAEIVIQRLNQVPDKNFLAYLDLLGASLAAPQPARVPLTFSVAAGALVDAFVPAGAQVAASPADGESEQITFETERELVVTSAQLDAVFVRDPAQDKFADATLIVASDVAEGADIFQGDRAVEHVLYIAQDRLLAYDEAIQEITITIRAAWNTQPPQTRLLQWEIWDGANGIPLTPVIDTTNQLHNNGSITFRVATKFPRPTVGSKQSRWLRCRLLTPVSRTGDIRKGMLSADNISLIDASKIGIYLNRANLPVEAAFTNLFSTDTSKDFFPFGEKPKYGDVFYLSNAEAFAKPDARLTLHVVMANPVGSDPSPVPRVGASADLILEWEYWNSTVWKSVGQAKSNGVTGIDTTKAFTATGTVSFMMPPDVKETNVNGVNNVWLRVRIASGNYGVESQFKLDEKNPAQYAKDADGAYILLPPTFAPPSIKTLTVNYEMGRSAVPQTTTTAAAAPEASASPDAVVIYNNFVYETVAPEAGGERPLIKPFKPATDEHPALYLGFVLPAGRASFPNRKISFFNRVVEPGYGEVFVPLSPRRSTRTGTSSSIVTHRFLVTNPSPQTDTFRLDITGTRWPVAVTPAQLELASGEKREAEVAVTIPDNTERDSRDEGYLTATATATRGATVSFATIAADAAAPGAGLHLAWEYWNAKEWKPLAVRDDTANLTRSGLIEFLAPHDFAKRREFALERYWLRVVWRQGSYESVPRVRRLLLNTTMAAQSLTFQDEIMGSSDAGKNQKFRTTHAPVLDGQQLEVVEPEIPPGVELERIFLDEGADAVSPVAESAGVADYRVRWHQVADFYGSGRRDRHYVLDRLTGEVRFGDGAQGMIPPFGSGNIRMAAYRAGGGAVGNRPAQTITQLQTTIPYVDKVVNVEAATGGADAETLDSLIARAPRTIRHRSRAVTPEDYEDIAMQASSDVARAKCVPLYNLVSDPDARVQRLGTVSLIVVPRSGNAKPLPGLELINRVHEYVDAHRLPVGELVVVGPEYVSVAVEVVVGLKSLERSGKIEADIQQTLTRFLHPLTGGAAGTGWDFGRKPRESDLYGLLEPVEGVDHINLLALTTEEDRAGVEQTRRFLVYSGMHKISLTFEDE